MTKEDAIKFIKDLFTLRTVWIDKGSGQWAVKKRFHPLLRSSFWVLMVIVCAGIYSGMNAPTHSEAVAEPKTVATLPDPEGVLPAPPVRKELVIPLKVSDNQEVNVSAKRDVKPSEKRNVSVPEKRDVKPSEKRNARVSQKRDEIILPSERNPETDRIIAPPSKTNPPKSQVSQTTRKKPETLPAPRVSDRTRYSVEVNKSAYTLTLYRDGEIVKVYPVAVGRNPGDKQRVGDNRTPTGNFRVVSIENASGWTHDFHDGKGKIKGAYGPWFLRLDAKGWKGIGIHGTHDPDSRGTMATEGCIRLSNEDIAELRQFAYKNMPVTIREN